MRVTGQGSEGGAVLPFVAISLVVLLGVGALAVDLGNGWQTRRNLVNATDAAALAAAQEYVRGGIGCDAVAADYVGLNMDRARLVECDHSVNGGIGRVRVEAEADVRAFFAPVLGLGDFEAGSITVVRYGAPSAVSGLRPFALCSQASPEFTAWLDQVRAGNGVTSAPIFIPLDGSNPAQCNGTGMSLGNWGYTNFGAGTPSNALTKQYILNGYPGEVSTGTWGATCANEPEHCYQASPGSAGNSPASEFASIVGKEVLFPIFDWARPAGGVNMELHIVAIVPATLTGAQLTGNPNQRGLTLVFSPRLVQGKCCDTTKPPTGVYVIEPCAVSRDESGCSA
jgi:hypothetical protein